MSLRYAAPQEMAKRWVSGRNESTETGMPSAASGPSTGASRRCSSSAVTRRGVRVTGGRPELDDVGALGSQLAGVFERVCGGEVPAAVGERVLGDVDDPDQAGLARREQRRRLGPGHSSIAWQSG